MTYILLFAFGFFIAMFFVTGCTRDVDHRDIKDWVGQQGELVRDVDMRHVSFGPYWVTKSRRIYKVSSSTGRIYWFRFGNFFSFDVEEQLSDKNYRTLK